MFAKNTEQVNKILVRTLAVCALAFVVLMICHAAGIFHFTFWLRIAIQYMGIIVSISPFILSLFKVPKNFLKYYTLIAMGALIGCLGCFTGIGIYLTYVAVPVASCLYFDKKLTWFSVAYGYLCMFFGVFMNTASRWEINYLGWSHEIAFRNYIIGFTLEYVIIMLFVLQFVKRASFYMASQREAMSRLEEEKEKYKKLSIGSKERITSLFMNDVITQKKRRSMVHQILTETDTFSEEDFMVMAQSHQLMAGLSDKLKNAENIQETMKDILGTLGDYLEIDRIVIMSGIESEEARLALQWNREGTSEVADKFVFMSEDDAEHVRKMYDEHGYLEYNPAYDIRIEQGELSQAFYEHFISGGCLGTQLWVPTLYEGVYNGAVYFDKYDTTPYTPSQKFLMAEAVTLITNYIYRIEAIRSSEAKSRYLSNMSHEIRTPMNAILGMSEVALRFEMPEEVKKCVKTIHSSSQGLLGIINDILDFSKIESGKIDIIPEEFETLSLINDVKVIAEERNKDTGLKLSFKVPDSLPRKLRGDSIRIKQVMVNLVNNAIKYTDEGSVEVSVRMSEPEGGKAWFVYSVKDTGQGIKDEDKKRLFETYAQFETAKNHHKEGTGLGLAISKQLTELMGGRIQVNSVYQQGSTFKLTIPVEVVDASSAGALENFNYADEEAFDVSKYVAEGAKVLLVDDNDINLVVAKLLLAPLKMDIETAMDGISALDKTREQKFDLILMDNFMPGMNGGDVATALRKEMDNPNVSTPIIALTADAMSGVKEQLISQGMDDFMSKPIDMQTACKKINKWLNKTHKVQ